MLNAFNKKTALFIILLLKCGIATAEAIVIAPLSGILPNAVPNGKTINAYYIVANTTDTALHNNFVKYLPSNVTQVTDNGAFGNTCGLKFDIQPWSTCILQLSISGTVNANDPSPAHHLTICQENGTCYNAFNRNDELNVVVGAPNSLVRVAVANIYKLDKSLQQYAFSSTDGGISWQSNLITNNIGVVRDVSCGGTNKLHCVAIGEAKDKDTTQLLYSFASDDGGRTWSTNLIEKVSYGFLTNIKCNGKYGELCIAIGLVSPQSIDPAKPVAYTSSNGGKIWVRHSLPSISSSTITPPLLRSVSCSGDGQNCVALGEANHRNTPNDPYAMSFYSYTTNDGGNTWDYHEIFSKKIGQVVNSLNAVSCNNDNAHDCLAVGHEDGHPIIYRSSNAGINWVKISPEYPSKFKGGSLNAISCGGQNNQYCITSGSLFRSDPLTRTQTFGVIYISNDNGSTWKILDNEIWMNGQYPNVDIEYKSLACNDSALYCTVVAKGRGNHFFLRVINRELSSHQYPQQIITASTRLGGTILFKNNINDKPYEIAPFGIGISSSK